MGAGDEIVITELDHHANVAPWRALERERGVRVTMVPIVPESGQVDWPALEQALARKPKLLAIGAASNALGTITDVARAAKLAREAGALTFVDAVHYAPHRLVDVRAIGCDFLACSAYKFYGPHVGVLYGRGGATRGGGHSEAPARSRERARAAGDGHAQSRRDRRRGGGGGVPGVARRPGDDRRGRLRASFGELHRRGQALVERVLTGLAAIDGVQVYGPPASAPRTPTVSFTVGDRHADEIADALAEEAVFVSTGDFYATSVVERYGLAGRGGLIRAGCAAYTTADEVNRLVDGVARVARRRPR